MYHLLAMQHYLTELWTWHIWTLIAAGAAIVSAVSIFADRRRHRRTQIEQVGFMPWTGISVFAIMVTLMATALAIKAG